LSSALIKNQPNSIVAVIVVHFLLSKQYWGLSISLSRERCSVRRPLNNTKRDIHPKRCVNHNLETQKI
jgi:hypothetical protein